MDDGFSRSQQCTHLSELVLAIRQFPQKLIHAPMGENEGYSFTEQQTTVVVSAQFCPSRGPLSPFPFPCSHLWSLKVLQRDLEAQW